MNEIFWENSYLQPYNGISINKEHIEDARKRLDRFRPFLEKSFPELKESKGRIESPLVIADSIKSKRNLPGNILIKLDSQLPVSGSIKARGGFYEVLKHAEKLALDNKLLTINDDYSFFTDFEDFFKNYSLSVGSTGNLGLSIGLMGAKLGFKVNVHMSSDAREWKKQMLREQGVTVYEYDSDYSFAVEEARKLSSENPGDYFIDDENSIDLFLGYSTSGREIKNDLDKFNIKVSSTNPLLVFLPCGVGGGPGGITFGLKEIYGDNVHCFFGEPLQSPAFFLGLYSQLHEKVNVRDIGLDNITIADGLAVGKPSGFVGRTLNHVINGCFTCKDEYLIKTMKEIHAEENLFLEPSAVIGFKGIDLLLASNYLKKRNIDPDESTFIIWGTGGNLVPEKIKKEYLNL